MPKAPLSGELSPQATERFSYYDCLLHPSPAGGQNLTEQVDNIMREIQIAQNKTRKLTKYGISDVELDEKTVTEDTSSSTTDGGKDNPDTGR